MDAAETDVTVLNADGSTKETVTDTKAGLLRSQSVRTVSGNGLNVTVQADHYGLGYFDQITTQKTQANGDVVQSVEGYNPDGSEINQVVTTTSANGLSKIAQYDPNGDGSFDNTQTDVTVLNADGSTTNTVTNISGATTTGTTVTTTSADGLSQTTQITQSGQLVETVKQTVTLNGDGSQIQTATVKSGNDATISQTATTVSADKKTTTIQKNIYGTTPWSTKETKALQPDGSTLDTVTDYNSAGAAAAIAIATIGANGLSKTATYDQNADGTIDETVSDIINIGGDGSKTETFTDTNGALNANAGGYTESATVVTVTSANGLSKTVTTTGMNGRVSLNHSSSQTTAINPDGSTISTDTETAGLSTDVSVVTTSRSGLSKTTQISSLGNGIYDRTDQYTVNLDGSSIETVTNFNTDGSIGEAETINTSTDGRTVKITDYTLAAGIANTAITTTTVGNNGDTTTVTTNSAGSGALLNKETIVTAANGLAKTITMDTDGNNAVDETKTDSTVLNADGSRTETIIETNGTGARIAQQVITTSADGLTTVTATYDASSLVSKATSVTANNPDGSTTNTTTTVSSSGKLLSKTVANTSADGRTVNTTWDLTGDGRSDASETSVTSADGVQTVTDTTYNATSGALATQTVTTTSANSREITIGYTNATDSSKNTVQTTLVSADGSGSYSWTQQDNSGATTVEANHLVDSNGIDHITYVKNGTTATYTISTAQVTADLVQAQNVYTALLGRDMTYAEQQTWLSYLTPAGLNLTQLANDLMSSSEFSKDYGALTNTKLIDLVYQNSLGRQPLSSEINTWSTQFDSGSLSRAGFVLDIARIANSPEGADQQFNVRPMAKAPWFGFTGIEPFSIASYDPSTGDITSTFFNSLLGTADRIITTAADGVETVIDNFNSVTGALTESVENLANGISVDSIFNQDTGQDQYTVTSPGSDPIQVTENTANGDPTVTSADFGDQIYNAATQTIGDYLNSATSALDTSALSTMVNDTQSALSSAINSIDLGNLPSDLGNLADNLGTALSDVFSSLGADSSNQDQYNQDVDSGSNIFNTGTGDITTGGGDPGSGGTNGGGGNSGGDFWDSLWNDLGNFFSDVGDFFSNVFDDIGNFFGDTGGFFDDWFDPLVLSTDRNGIHLLSLAQSNAYFDFSGNGLPQHSGWIGSGTGFLILEQNGSPQLLTFASLAALDTNKDGVLDANDPAFANLKVWENANGDGTVQQNQFVSLASLGIQSIGLTSTPTNKNAGGNVITAIGNLTYSDGTTGALEQVTLASPQSTAKVALQGTSTASLAYLARVQEALPSKAGGVAQAVSSALSGALTPLTTADATLASTISSAGKPKFNGQTLLAGDIYVVSASGQLSDNTAPAAVRQAEWVVQSAVTAVQTAAQQIATATANQTAAELAAVTANLENAMVGLTGDVKALNAAATAENSWQTALATLATASANFSMAATSLSTAQNSLNGVVLANGSEFATTADARSRCSDFG